MPFITRALRIGSIVVQAFQPAPAAPKGCTPTPHPRRVRPIDFHHFGWINRKTSLGYWLDAEHEGCGLMTAAVRAMTDHAIRILKLNRVEIQAATGNATSRAIPQRLGFRHEGTLREAGFLYDHYVDFEMYAMLASEWSKQRPTS